VLWRHVQQRLRLRLLGLRSRGRSSGRGASCGAASDSHDHDQQDTHVVTSNTLGATLDASTLTPLASMSWQKCARLC
jgi:hypothetical protein